MSETVRFTLNGAVVDVHPRPGELLLLDVLRDSLGLTGTKEGCGAGECGACTVIVDGKPVNSCLYPVWEAEGRDIRTIEGIGGPGLALSPVQKAFVDLGGIQCGFCTPGMILSTEALLEQTPDPDDTQIRDALAGNLCRCTGYVQIIHAVKAAAAELRESEGER